MAVEEPPIRRAPSGVPSGAASGDAAVPAADPAAPEIKPLPRGSLGVPHIVFFVVAASAPLTVAAGGVPQSLAVTGTTGIPLVYLILAAMLAVFSSGYAAMSRRITGAGAFYAYVSQGLGRVAGVGAAFVAVVAYNAMQIGIYGLFGFTTSDFLNDKFGWDLDWWLIVLIGIAVVGVLGYLRVDLNARVLAVLLTIETATIVVFDAGAFHAAPHGVSLDPFTWSALTAGSTGAAFCFVMASFTGFESAALYGEECKDPRRTVARSTYIAVGVIGVLYAVTAWALMTGTGANQAVAQSQENGPNLVFVLADDQIGSGFSDVAQAFLITSLFAALLSFHNAVARYFFSLGREGVLPRGLGRSHARHGSPHIGSLAQTALAALVVGVFAVLKKDPLATLFNWLTNVGALGVILLLVLTSLGVAVYFRRTSGGAGPDEAPETLWNRLVAPLVAAVSLAVVFVLAVDNFGVLLGVDAGSSLRWVLPALVIGAGVVGTAYGAWLRRAKPEVYAGVGRGAGA
ncbi:APC family permease [Yinghuangia seranimata]|uniref:APC family permease n=1 Tax=Yinghuangia seranimata TaxID=408067 RepID=UPI00248C50B9|nr:APC family permease [Yinghuangia seranimata]MDI2132735.1 APC family permease [Yinghuangia seranimata]